MQKYLKALLLLVLCIGVLSFNITPNNLYKPKLTQKCIDVLPYPRSRINHDVYYTWFGKVG
jgi:hypothetical protein